MPEGSKYGGYIALSMMGTHKGFMGINQREKAGHENTPAYNLRQLFF